MNVVLTPRISHDRQKIYYSLEWGKSAGQRVSTGIFTYSMPIGLAQEDFNKRALELLEARRLEILIDLFDNKNSLTCRKYEHNFLIYYGKYVKRNKIAGNRHLECSYSKFKKFINTKYISPRDITEELSFNFRRFLLNHFNGETPANYFSRFKQVLKAASKQGYFKSNPAQDIPAMSNRNKKRKNNLEVEDYLMLLQTLITNEEVRDTFIFCCYTGLRWCDVCFLTWADIQEECIGLYLDQRKTHVHHYVYLHSIAKEMLEKRRRRLTNFDSQCRVFHLPTNNGCNKVLGEWCKAAVIDQHITGSCAKLSFSILLQEIIRKQQVSCRHTRILFELIPKTLKVRSK